MAMEGSGRIMAVGRLPEWFKIPKPEAKSMHKIEELVKRRGLHTVCHEANCPNKGKCFKEGSVTFMILGKYCSRNCTFCNVGHEKPYEVDGNEPMEIANSVKDLGLKHIVITSVTRDDLPDGGASQFVKVIECIEEQSPQTNVEVLISDLGGNYEALQTIVSAKPVVIGHNIETVKRLYATVRPQARYSLSLSVLKRIKELDPTILTKSGIMVGLSETKDEVIEAMTDLRASKCDILTIGQYLRPSKSHIEIYEYVHPDTFKEYEDLAYSLGFKAVASGPFVRSSFNALEVFKKSKEE